ncbi:MAG: hypothetical protein NVS3B16_10370 [Vulcanimicrobiaceae bacterium]
MLLPFDTIARSVDFDERAGGMELRPWQWDFLFAVDGRTKLSDLASACAIDLDTASELVHETQALGLVEIVTLSLEHYRAASAYVAPVIAAAPRAEVATDVHAVSRKAVSLSFDAFPSVLASLDTPAPEANVAPREPVVEPPAAYAFPDDVPMHAEMHDDPAREETMPAPAEPLAVVEPIPSEIVAVSAPVKKNVSFTLSADSFGLPTAPSERDGYEAYAEAPAPRDAVAVSALRDDVVAVQQFQVTEPPSHTAPAQLPAFEPAHDGRPNGDLTGVVLRVLGLKK